MATNWPFMTEFDPMLAFKLDARQVETFYEAIECGNLQTIIVEENNGSSISHLIERFKPQAQQDEN